MKKTHTSVIRVRYAETDQMRMVYYGRYLEYFEAARTEMLRAWGVPYRSFEEEGYYLPVLEAHVTYHRSARYDDELRVETTIDFRNSPRLRIEYTVLRGAEKIATGHTIHAFIKTETGKPCKPPKRFLDAIAG